MPGSDGLRILGDFWKKAASWDLNLEEACGFSSLRKARSVGSTWCAARCWVRWNSQQSRNCVSLSSCRKPKSQEGNKSFVPELPRVIGVSGFLCIWTFYTSVYLYILRISMFRIFVFRICYSFPVSNNSCTVIKGKDWCLFVASLTEIDDFTVLCLQRRFVLCFTLK